MLHANRTSKWRNKPRLIYELTSHNNDGVTKGKLIVTRVNQSKSATASNKSVLDESKKGWKNQTKRIHTKTLSIISVFIIWYYIPKQSSAIYCFYTSILTCFPLLFCKLLYFIFLFLKSIALFLIWTLKR